MCQWSCNTLNPKGWFYNNPARYLHLCDLYIHLCDLRRYYMDEIYDIYRYNIGLKIINHDI